MCVPSSYVESGIHKFTDIGYATLVTATWARKPDLVAIALRPEFVENHGVDSQMHTRPAIMLCDFSLPSCPEAGVEFCYLDLFYS